MATSARLDELKKKFDENPRRYFAPLANEYRKLGDLTQAIAICRAHLPNQVGHISGHIVLAQALYEARELGESRQVFESALELDPENLIALRFLGDIAREQDDPETARIWYERVLEADPRNYEISQVLRDLSSAPDSTVSERDLSSSSSTSARSSHTASSFAPPGYREDAVAEAVDVGPAENHGGSLGASELEDGASTVESPYELPTQGEDPFSTLRTSSHAPALEDPFADESSRFDNGSSPGELEAVAEPSHDDWFASSTVEINPGDHPTPAFTDSFFPDLGAAAKVSSGPGHEFAKDPASLETHQAIEDAFSSSAPGDVDGVTRDSTEHDSTEDVTPRYVAAVDAFHPGALLEPDASFETDASESFAFRASSDVIDEASEPFAATAGNAEDDPFVVLSDDDADVDVSWAPSEVGPIEGLLSMEAGAAPIGADPRIEPIEGRISDDVEDAFYTGGSYDESSESHEDLTPRFFADPIFGRTPTLEAVEPEPTPAAFVTETMAELYLQQGFTQEALEVYRQLLSRSPNDELLRERVAALESGSPSAVLSSEYPPLPPDRDGQSVRAFFARFAHRQPSRRPPPPAGNDRDRGEGAEAASPLSLGTSASDTRDEHYGGAATRDEALTVPDGGSFQQPTLSQLFSGAPTARDDDIAAKSLASAFTLNDEGPHGVPASSPATMPEDGELSLEHLFRDVPSRSAGAVTLDEFYASSGTTSSDPNPERTEETGESDADIEQFTAWLEGLKKK